MKYIRSGNEMTRARSTAPFRINVTRKYCSVERGLGYKINVRGSGGVVCNSGEAGCRGRDSESV